MKLIDESDTRKGKYSKNELLEFLKQFQKENGRAPMQEEFSNNPKYPEHKTYFRRFGSWNIALKLAGLDVNCFTETTNEELLTILKQFYEEYKIPPTCEDFSRNPRYPHFRTYFNRFGSWNKALKLAGLDLDSMIKKGIIIENNNFKGRLFEIYVNEHFTNKPIDLSGDNRNNPYDGICPNNQIYDSKSAQLRPKCNCWEFKFGNMYKDDIEWFYLGGFDKDYKSLLYVWRAPGEFIESNFIKIGIQDNYRYNVKNMKEYEITNKFNFNIFK